MDSHYIYVQYAHIQLGAIYVCVFVCPPLALEPREVGCETLHARSGVPGDNIGPFWFLSELVSGAVPGAPQWPGSAGSRCLMTLATLCKVVGGPGASDIDLGPRLTIIKCAPVWTHFEGPVLCECVRLTNRICV